MKVLEDYFREKTSLLILDNCEHLVAACAQLSDSLLRACPGLHIMVNSREALGIAGETIYHVPPLATPAAGASSPAEVRQSDAGQLFVERAKTVVADFEVTFENAAAIAQVCRLVDGIPMAIELAAARVSLLTVEEITTRLDDRFRLLTGGSRTALPRHQTLHALIDWSWELLSEAEQALLRRLSVFAGGWSLEAAEAVDGNPYETLDLLTSLVNKSMVIAERPKGQTARYHMLETIRLYGQEKLALSAEGDQVRTQHRDWFMALAERAEPHLKSHDQIVWVKQLELEHDNLRSALEWSLGQRDVEPALRLVGALSYFWAIRGYFDEGYRWRQEAVSLAESTPALKRSQWRAKALLGISQVFQYQHPGSITSEQAYAEEALSIFRELGDTNGISCALLSMSRLSLLVNDYQALQSRAEESLAIMQKENNLWGIGNCLYMLASVAESKKEYQKSNSMREKGVASIQKSGDRWCLSHHLGETVWEIWDEGNTERARILFEEELQIYREFGDKAGEADILQGLTILARFRGDDATAFTLGKESLELHRELGHIDITAYILGELGLMALRRGNLLEAETDFETGIRLQREFRSNFSQVNIGVLLAAQGRLAYYRADYPQAQTLLENSLAILEQSEEKSYSVINMRVTFSYLGDVARARGENQQSVAWFQKSLAIIKTLGSMPYAPEPLEGLAKAVGLLGQLERAARLLCAAQSARLWMNTPLPPVDCPDYERSLAGVHSALGEDRFQAAWAEGQKMTLQQAIDYALGDK
jgi:predicted ATPase